MLFVNYTNIFITYVFCKLHKYIHNVYIIYGHYTNTFKMYVIWTLHKYI